MTDRLKSIFATVIACSLLTTSVTWAQETPITESRHRLDALEQPVLQLAEQVRAMEAKQGKDHAESIKLRSELRDLVQKTFAARQEIQRTELAEFNRRLQKMQQTIDAREKSVDRIVDRRVEELLDPNLKWTHSEDHQKPLAATFQSENRKEFRPPGVSLDEDYAPTVTPPQPAAVKQIQEDSQIVTLTMFEVSDTDFAKDSKLIPRPTVDPTEFERLLTKLRDSKTVRILGTHSIMTTFNQTSTFHSGGTIELPSSASLPEGANRNAEIGTRITIKSHMKGNERVYECIWNERHLDRNKTASGIPSVTETQSLFVVNSPVPGNTGHVSGPFGVSEDDQMRFIYFYLHGPNELRPPGTSPDENSTPTDEPPEPVDVNQIRQDTQKVALTLFEVSDLNFMKDRENGAEPFVAPTDLAEQLQKMMESKTAMVLGSHTIETILNQTATFDGGGTFEVPPVSPTLKGEVEIGNRIRVTQRMVGDETVFEIAWQRHISDFNNAVNRVPPTSIRVESVAIKSPLPGGTGYICGPFAGSDRSHRRFVHFFLNGTADAIPASTQQPKRSQDPLASLQGEWKLEQLTEGGGENEGNDRRVTITKDLLNIYAETGELKTVFQLEILNDQTVNAVLDPNGERLKLTGIFEVTAERLQLCLGKEGTPPTALAPGAEVIYLAAKRSVSSTAAPAPSSLSTGHAEFLRKLQGNWECEVFNMKGEALQGPDAFPILEIEGSVALTQIRIGGIEDYPSSKAPEGIMTDFAWLQELVGFGTPQQVNLVFDPNGEKEQQYGIIECTEDRLRLCVGAEDSASELSRPKFFAPGSNVMYIEARRPTSRPAAKPEGEE